MLLQIIKLLSMFCQILSQKMADGIATVADVIACQW